MHAIDPATTVRGLNTGRAAVFLLHCDWRAGMGTSLHRHAGWELVLIERGALCYVLDRDRGTATEGSHLKLPAGSTHAIWAEEDVAFEVMGEEGLGLTIMVPDGDGTTSLPVYGPTAPWAEEPPPGVGWTTPEEMDRLRLASRSLLM